MTTSVELNFTDLTTAAIVAGRGFSTARTVASWRRLAEAVDRLAAELAFPLAIVVATDFSSSAPGEEIMASALIGLLVASTDRPYPHAVDAGELRTAFDRAAAIPWEAVAALIGPIEFPDSPLEAETSLWAAATGPLAGGYFAFGVPAADEARSREPSLEFVAGKDMSQRSVEEGVWGVSIAYNGDWEASRLDLGAAAHEERVAMLGALASSASYYLMACYD